MAVTTFSFTTGATVSSWTVPNHTGLVTITAIGGGGGTSVGYAVGGDGARLAGTCTLTPGTVLTIIEGGGGGNSWNEPGGARRGGAGGGATGWKGGNGGDGTGSWIIPNGWQAGDGIGGSDYVHPSVAGQANVVAPTIRAGLNDLLDFLVPPTVVSPSTVSASATVPAPTVSADNGGVVVKMWNGSTWVTVTPVVM